MNKQNLNDLAKRPATVLAQRIAELTAISNEQYELARKVDAQLGAFQNLLGELYQVLGALDAGTKVLDQVSAAINGQPLPHATLLPYLAEPGTGAGGVEPSLLGYINVPTLEKLLRGISYPTTICSAIPNRTDPDTTPDESWAVPIYVMRRPGEQL